MPTTTKEKPSKDGIDTRVSKNELKINNNDQQHQNSLHSHQQAAPKSPTRSTKRQPLLIVCNTINTQAAADPYN